MKTRGRLDEDTSYGISDVVPPLMLEGRKNREFEQMRALITPVSMGWHYDSFSPGVMSIKLGWPPKDGMRTGGTMKSYRVSFDVVTRDDVFVRAENEEEAEVEAKTVLMDMGYDSEDIDFNSFQAEEEDDG